jgi:tungstate transport system substrate-binding protein
MRWVCAIAAVALMATPGPALADVLRLAVTTSFQNSGLSDILLPEIAADTSLDVHLIVVGTGQAIRLGKAGDVDAILVHSRRAEDAFVTAGFGTHRREIMFNDFVLVGPAADPAGARNAESATAALRAIALGNVVFTSRGDDSGTHRRELSLWTAAGINPEGPLYRELGAGMGATLNTAVAMGAYALSDRASWLNFGNKGGLKIVYQGDPALFNQYTYIPVSPERHPHVEFALAEKLEDWLASDKGQKIIGTYTIDGQTLFTPNAADN